MDAKQMRVTPNGNLHGILNLIIDSALAADDAATRDDSEGLAVAIGQIERNSNQLHEVVSYMGRGGD